MILKAEVLGSAHPLPQGIITLRDTEEYGGFVC